MIANVLRVVHLALKLVMRPFGLAPVRKDHIRRLQAESELLHKLSVIEKTDDESISLVRATEVAKTSPSQNGQDLFALAANKMKQGGFFVEFGATDGVTSSNTYLLETMFSWTGILAEPSKYYHDALRKNRQASISENCVWTTSGENLPFMEATIPELSSLQGFEGVDMNRRSQKPSRRYEVESISLLDLLRRFNAPRTIDFLSVDTEGSEFEILNSFDFSQYVFNAICVEHNYGSSRGLIANLLGLHGYVRVLESSSKWDDWFVRKP